MFALKHRVYLIKIYHFQITYYKFPLLSKFKSLNLSHSLTVICYEIFKFLNNKKINKKSLNLKISSKSKILSVVNHLIDILENFF